ncbi:MAG: hypothetical protein FJX60_07575 [Alphaproteobacteria bacterium]|nr:hypothetical protein [Alphaproteobacteria bacterium]
MRARMGIVGILKAIGAAAMAVAIFYVGGMASLEALGYLGQFDWAIKTAAFWTGGVVLALVLAEMTRRIIADIAAFLEEEADRPQPKAESEAERDEPPPKQPARPATAPPKPPAPAKVK